MSAAKNRNIVLHGYQHWSIRPIGVTTEADAKIACRAELENSEYDCVRAIDVDTSECIASFERDDDGQIVDQSHTVV